MGSAETIVTITGTNLNNPTLLNIAGIAAIAIFNNRTSLVAMLMTEAITGAVSVTTAGSTASSSADFNVMPTLYPAVQQGNKLVGTGNVGLLDRCHHHLPLPPLRLFRVVQEFQV